MADTEVRLIVKCVMSTPWFSVYSQGVQCVLARGSNNMRGDCCQKFFECARAFKDFQKAWRCLGKPNPVNSKNEERVDWVTAIVKGVHGVEV